jgi:GDP-4-dehydro-6-deoxy-D-mannose reductase
MTVFITGMTGFIGSHLAELLLAKGEEVHGTVHFKREMPNIEHVKKDVEVIKCDIRDLKKVEEVIKRLRPKEIYHLAAQSFPTVSWEDPFYTMETNVMGTTNLFEAVKRHDVDTAIFVACSSAEYGFVSEDEVPVRETHALNPLHPYGVSKVATDMLAYQYFKNFGIRSIRGRIFNTTGPRKMKDVSADFSQQVAMIGLGKQDPRISVGNLDPRRDITDVRDMVEAMWVSLRKAEFGEAYNLCSSHAVMIKDLLDSLIGLSEKDIEVFQDPKLLRPTDEPVIMGDNSKFRKATGWMPKVKLERTLGDMVDHWMKVLA